MPDGFATMITLGLNPTAKFWEKTVTPPGLDGGDAVETTTMHSAGWRTFAARNLKTLTDLVTTAAYDPDVFSDDEVVGAINREDTITVTFPDGSTLAFFGYLRLFEPQEMNEGDQPEAQITITPTNWDHVNFVEAGPVMTEVPGTP